MVCTHYGQGDGLFERAKKPWFCYQSGSEITSLSFPYVLQFASALCPVELQQFSGGTAAPNSSFSYMPQWSPHFAYFCIMSTSRRSLENFGDNKTECCVILLCIDWGSSFSSILTGWTHDGSDFVVRGTAVVTVFWCSREKSTISKFHHCRVCKYSNTWLKGPQNSFKGDCKVRVALGRVKADEHSLETKNWEIVYNNTHSRGSQQHPVLVFRANTPSPKTTVLAADKAAKKKRCVCPFHSVVFLRQRSNNQASWVGRLTLLWANRGPSL